MQTNKKSIAYVDAFMQLKFCSHNIAEDENLALAKLN